MFEMISKALKSELFRFKYDTQGSKIVNISELNLYMVGSPDVELLSDAVNILYWEESWNWLSESDYLRS